MPKKRDLQHFCAACYGLPQLSQLLFRRFVEYSLRDASPSGFKIFLISCKDTFEGPFRASSACNSVLIAA